MTDSVEDFSAMLRRALGPRIDPPAASFVEMFAEDGVMEFPYAPPGGTELVKGRRDLIAYLAEFSQAIVFDRVGKLTVHETTDPATVVIEFEGFGRGAATGEPYHQRYVSIIRTARGRIVHYKDYWNPLALIQATHGWRVSEGPTDGEVQRG